LGTKATYETFVKRYLRDGLLKAQRCDFDAINKLILRARKELEASRANLNIDAEIAYSVAYTAMLRAGRALLQTKGLRPADGFQHKTVVDFVSFMMGAAYGDLTKHFDIMRKKRNMLTYELTPTLSKTEAKNAIRHAEEFVNSVADIIRKENPQTKFEF
jgi:uncharacterized protein (UPF0332 family)